MYVLAVMLSVTTRTTSKYIDKIDKALDRAVVLNHLGEIKEITPVHRDVLDNYFKHCSDK